MRSSQSWKTFLRNHAEAIIAIDICIAPTLTFERLFAFLVLGHGRRQRLWFDVTRHPTAAWLAQQITEAFPWAWRRPKCAIMTEPMGASSPPGSWRWASETDRSLLDRPGLAERLIGTLRRDCL